MSETLSQIIAKMGTPAKPTGSTPKVPKEPKVPKVVQKARQTAVKRSPNPFVQAVEQAFKPTTPTKPQEPNLGQIIKQFKDVASSGRKQRGETLMQEYIRNTQPVSGNMGFKAGSGKGATIEAEMAAYDRKTFGAETYGKRPKGVSTAEWSKRQSHKGKFKQLAGTRNEQVAELDREIEAYKLENMTPVQRLELARETAGGLPGFYDKERASALAASLMGSQDLKDKTDASLFIRAANQVMQPVSTAYTVAMKDPRSLAEMPVGLQVGLSAGDLGAQIVGGFLTGGGSTPATASTLARIGAVATRSLALDAPGYIQMIEDAGGVDKALVAYKDMIGKALDPNSKISASERVNGIALAGMIVLSGGGKIAGKGPHADPNITTRLIETEAVPGSASDLRGQVGGVGLDAEPALRPGVAEPVAGVEPEKGAVKTELIDDIDASIKRSEEVLSKWQKAKVEPTAPVIEPLAKPTGKAKEPAKEPWQKTLEQLRRGNSRVAKPGTPRYYESQPDYDLSKLIRSGDRMAIIEASKRSRERGFRSPGEWENAIQREADALRETHRDAIVKALAEGKPVPKEVLADYPDLAKKYDAPAKESPAAPKPVAKQESGKAKLSKEEITANLNKAKKEKDLSKRVVWENGSGTRRDYADSLIESGYRPRTREVVDQAKVDKAKKFLDQRMGASILSYSRMDDEAAQIVKNPPMKTSYEVVSPSGQYRVIEKTVHDYMLEKVGSYVEPQRVPESEFKFKAKDFPHTEFHNYTPSEVRKIRQEIQDDAVRFREETGSVLDRGERFPNEREFYKTVGSYGYPTMLIRRLRGGLDVLPRAIEETVEDLRKQAAAIKTSGNSHVDTDAANTKSKNIKLALAKELESYLSKDTQKPAKEPWQMTREEFGENPDTFSHAQPNSDWAANAESSGLRLTDTLRKHLRPDNETSIDDVPMSAWILRGVDNPYGKHLALFDSTGARILREGTKEFDDIANGLNKNAVMMQTAAPDIVARAQKAGYDAVEFKGTNIGTVVLNPDKFVSHRQIVKQALAEGKPVPPEVLADYPLLKPAERVEMEALKGQSGATADSVEPAGTSSRDGEPEMPATGLARQFTDPERFARELEETRAPAQSVQKLVDATQAEWGDGGHVKAELALRRGNEPDFNPTREQIVKDTAMVAHLKREVKNEYDRLLRKDDPTPQDMADIQAVVAKLNEIDEYAQKIRTHWHDLGMALQIAYKPDFTVADLTMRARAANGGDISPDAQKQINDWVSKYEAAQKELEELRKAKPPKEVSGVAVSKPRAARATAFNRLANLGLEVRGEDGALVAPTKGGGMKGGKQAGAVAIPKLTPSMENELRKSIRQIAKAYIVDEHPIAGSLDGVVTLVRKHLPSLSEEDILRYLSDRYHRVLLDSDLQRRESQAFMRRIQAAADYRNKTLLEKGFAQAGALLNTTQRGLQASMDLSAPFRQGRRLMVTKEWVNAWLPSTKAMFAKDPQKAMELHSAELARSPYYSKGVESGLGISSDSKPEEVWAGRLLQDWAAGKGLAAGKANPLRVYANLIQRSEAHYTIFLNDLRMRLFENLAKRNPNDKEYLESIAQMINVMTGRGHGKTATMLSHPAAGNVFYAPRYAWSEVQSTGMVPIWKTKSKMARQEAIKAYGRNFAVTVVGLSLARLFGNEVELDPRATDFLKVRLQNGKVVDVLGASQQYLRLLVRMGYGSTSRKGFYSEPGAFGADPLMQAVNNKLSPAARSLLGLLRGWASPNADGDWEKQPAGMILRDAVTPMGARKTGDQMWSDGDKWALLNLLGIDYEKGQPNKRQRKGSRPPKLEGLPQGMRQFAGHAPITGR